MKHHLRKALSVFSIVTAFVISGQTINVDGINYQLNFDSSGRGYAETTGYDGHTAHVKIVPIIEYLGNSYSVTGGNLSFSGSKSLVSVTYAGDIPVSGAFDNCVNLEHVYFTHPIDGFSMGSFYNCYKLDLSDILGHLQIDNDDFVPAHMEECFGLETPTQYDQFDCFDWESCYGAKLEFHSNISNIFENRLYKSVKWPFKSNIIFDGDVIEMLESNWGELSGLFHYSGSALESRWYAPNLKEVVCHGEFFSAGEDSTPNLETITLKHGVNKVYLGYTEENYLGTNVYLRSGLENLSKLTIEDKNSIEILKICGSGKLNLDWIGECSNLKELELADISSVTSITLPSSIESLRLYNLPSLTTINNCEKAKKITIESCPMLEDLDLSTAENVSLSNNPGLKNLYLGASLKSYFSNQGNSYCNPSDQELEIIYAGTIGQWHDINFDNWAETKYPSSSFNTAGFLANVTKLWYGNGKQKKEYLIELNDTILPENLHQLKHGPFTGYRGLEKVSLSNKIRHIGYGTFAGCSNLSVININPDEIQSGTFYNCKAISEITLGENVKEITLAFPKKTNNPYHFSYRGSASEWCKVRKCNLTSMETDYIINYTYNLRMDCTGTPFTYASQSNLINSKTGELELTDPEEIGDQFNNPKLLKSVKIKFYRDAGITTINPSAFSHCDSLESITVEDYSGGTPATSGLSSRTLTSDNNRFIVGERAFSDCTKLKNNEILDHLKSYGRDAMHNTAWMKNQPDGPVYLYSSDQGKIVITYYNGTIPEETSIIIDHDATWFQGSSSFDYASCSNVKSISLPEGIEVMESYWMPWQAITTNFEFPSSVTRIGQNIFYNELDNVRFRDGENPIEHADGCYFSKVKNLYIGRDVKDGILFSGISVENATYGPDVTTISQGNSIGYSSSPGLKHLYSLSVAPPACENVYDTYNALTMNINTDDCILHVPDGCYDAYRNAEGWKEFAHIMEDIKTTSVITAETDDNTMIEIHYDISGRVIDPATPGLHIVKKGSAVNKTIVK